MRDVATIIGDFDFGFRRMRLRLDQLRLAQGWGRGEPGQDGGEPRTRGAVLVDRLDGRARLDRGDGLQIVGERKVHTGFLSTVLRPYVGVEELIEHNRRSDDIWKALAGNGLDERSAKLLAMQEEDFSASPKTAALGFTKADSEIGLTEEWWVELWVPREVFDGLVLQLRREEKTAVEVVIERPLNLVRSQYTPPAYPEVFGVLAERGSGGWVDSISWHPTKYADLGRPGAALEDGDSGDGEEEEDTAPAPRFASSEELRFVMTETLAAVRAVNGWLLLVGLVAVLGLFF